jgi:hypothetical protein
MGRYVYLIDPGDVLVFRNIQDVDAEYIDNLNRFLGALGINAIVFDGDVDIAMLTVEEIARLRSVLDEAEKRVAGNGGEQPPDQP